MEPPPTLEELVKELRISLHLLDQKCSNEHLKSISLFLDWRRVAPHLGLSERDIEGIKADKKTESERRLKVLQNWKQLYGYKATFKNFVSVLMEIGNADDAERVCRLLQTPADEHSASTATATTPTTPGDHQQSSPVTAAEANLCSTVVETPKVSDQRDIDREIRELEDEFLKVVKEAAKNLRTAELSDVKLCLTQLPVSVRFRHIRFLEHNLSAIASATSVDEILAILGLYWNYYNCSLLDEVVHQLGSDQTKQLMERYMEKLRRFRLKTKLRDFAGKLTHRIPHFHKLVTKMDEKWEERTLEDLEEFRKELAQSMLLENYAIHIMSAEEGCVEITWALHSPLPAITDTLQSAFQVLEKKYSVLRVIFQGKYIPESKSPESPPLDTPPAPLPLPPPPERSELETNTFDMIDALLRAGVPHIVEQILHSLDEESLVMSEQVSSTWRDIIGDLCIWKHLIKHKRDSNPLWRVLFKKRGWHKYLDMPLGEQISRRFYRQLHHSAFKDIHSLEANWKRGHCTLTKVQTGSEVSCLQCHDSKIVTGHTDKTIKIWDRSTLQVLKILKGHKMTVYCLQYNEEVVISGAGTVKVWDIQTGHEINDLLHLKGAVYSLKFTTDTLVTASSYQTVTVWNIKSLTDISLKMTLKGHVDRVFAVDLNETTIISGSEDETIKVWDKFTGKLVRTLHGHSNSVRCLQLLGSHLISGSNDKTLRVWDANTGECIRVLHGHKEHVTCVSVDNKRILSGSYDNKIKVWDLAAALGAGSSSDTLCITTLRGHIDTVYGIQSDDFQIISSSSDGTLVIRDFLESTPPILQT